MAVPAMGHGCNLESLRTERIRKSVRGDLNIELYRHFKEYPAMLSESVLP
jgi:hypothetical protein